LLKYDLEVAINKKLETKPRDVELIGLHGEKLDTCGLIMYYF